MERTKKILFFAIYWILYSGLVARYIGFEEVVKFGLDILVFVIVFRLIPLDVNKGLMGVLIGRWLPLVALAFFGITTLTALVESLNLITILWGIRMSLRYFLILYAIIRLCDREDVDKFKKIMDVAFIWNAVFCFLQLLSEVVGDMMGGLFIGNGQLAMFLVLMTFIYTADYLKEEKSLLEYAIRLAVSFAIAIFAEVKMLYFVIPLCVYGTYVFMKKFSVGHVVALVIGLYAFVPVISSVLSLYYDKSYVDRVTDQEHVMEYNESSYGFTKLSFNRNTCIPMCHELILKKGDHQLFGYGIGSGTASSRFGTDIYKKYGLTTFYFYFTPSYVLVEGGWIGFVLFVLFYALLLWRFYVFYKETEEPTSKYWATMGLLASLMTFLMIWYGGEPYTNYYQFFVFWGFCFVGLIQDEEEIEEANDNPQEVQTIIPNS